MPPHPLLMLMLLLLLRLAAGTTCWHGESLGAEELTLPVSANTSICAAPGEQTWNCGGAARLKIKGIENIILIACDYRRLQGGLVSHALLHMRGCQDHAMLRQIGLSTVATTWMAGTGVNRAAAPGESCFLSPAQGQWSWAGPGSTFLDVVWGRGGTIWAQSRVQPDQAGWYAIPVDGRLLEACACGLSSGLAVSDDNGQTMNVSREVDPRTNHSNNALFGILQAQSAPYLTLTLTASPRQPVLTLPVTVGPWTGGPGDATGGVEVSWPGPTDAAARAAILGYQISIASGRAAFSRMPSWRMPAVPPAGEPCHWFLSAATAAPLRCQIVVIARGGASIATGIGEGLPFAGRPAVAPLNWSVAASLPLGSALQGPLGGVWAVPELAKVHPVSGNVLEEAGVDYAGPPAGSSRRGNTVWNGAEHRVALQALRNEWTAFQLICETAPNQPAGRWQILTHPLTTTDGSAFSLQAPRLSRAWYQQPRGPGQGWYADPLLPLASGEGFTIPDPDNQVPGQRIATVSVEVFVPREAPAGVYSAPVEIQRSGQAALVLTLTVTVFPATIPDEAHFTFSMNAYASPAADYGAVGSTAFLAAERAFYAMAQEHRTTLAVLGYSHSANFQPGIAWPLSGQGARLQVADWSAWDRRFGPYFDGSAFAGTARAGVPLDHFYLPLMESYPTPMAEGYRWNSSSWEDHWQVDGPVAEGFSDTYRQQWVAVLRSLTEHIRQKRWTTHFQVYLNDKYYYKEYDPRRRGDGPGTSFWLLDEPMHVDDFSALAFFAGLTREAQRGDRSTVVFRADISRPQWGRDLLDRQLDVQVSGAWEAYRPWLEEWQERYGQTIWTYGSTPASDVSACAIEAQALDLYSSGVDGYVPWLVLGDARSWTNFQDTCVIYSGLARGVLAPCSSIRLQGYRRAEQDVEYLRLLAERLGLMAQDPHRHQIRALLGQGLFTTRAHQMLDSQGAVTTSIQGVRLEALEGLRQDIRERLR